MTTTPFQKLLDIIAQLRHPTEGCPWDLKQTHTSLKKYLIEEAYETLDAIDNDRPALPEELGDVLLQVVLHAQIGKDEGTFSIDDVITTLNEKLIRRHPHIFSDTKVEDADEVKKNWDKIKQEEKTTAPSLLDEVTTGTPALFQAGKIGEAVTKVGFDWDSPQSVLAKVREELEEVEQELAHDTIKKDALAEEIGDTLFTLAQLARLCGEDAETLLLAANQKFSRRFTKLEELAQKDLAAMSFEELHELWDQIKAQEKQ